MAYNDDKLSWCAELAEQYLWEMSSLESMSGPQAPAKLQLDEILKRDTNMIHMGDLEELGLNNEEALAALIERGLGDLKQSFSLTKEIVGAKAATHAKSIFENFALLGKIMDRHQSTMHKRWLKKSNQKRRSILFEAWGPNMALSHRPDFEALDKESDQQRYEGTRFRDAFMWPYINQEDLSKPHTIFVFMSTRGISLLEISRLFEQDCKAWHSQDLSS